MRTHDFAFLAISGFNIRAVVALCRYCSSRAIPLHIVARNESDPIYLTSYRANVLLERVSPALDAAELCRWLVDLRKAFGYRTVLIAPSSEYFNRFLLANRGPIEAAGGVVPLVDEALYRSVSDKHSFTAMCRDSGIAVPAEFDVPPERFPFVAKRRTYGSSGSGRSKPYLVQGREDLATFTGAEDPAEFYFQEYVHGASLYLLMHLSRNGRVTSYSQQNLIQQCQGGSIVLAKKSDFHLGPESTGYARMLRQSGFHGLIMIEVRRSERTGADVMIEANPRMWGPIQFTLDNDIDLFGELVADFAGSTDGPPGVTSDSGSRSSDYYFWSGGLSESARPFAFHAFTPENFVDDFSRIAACDLFNRPDTAQLYWHELASR